MAYDNASEFITLPATTGLVQYQLVNINSAGKIATPALGARVIGVLVSSGTNGSTDDTRYGTVQINGVSKVLAASSTATAGETLSASAIGYAKNTTGSAAIAGVQVEGTSGASGRVISILLTK